MKILYINHAITWDGASIALYNIIREIRQRNDVYVVTPKSNKSYTFVEKMEEMGIPIYKLNFKPNIYPYEIKNPFRKVRDIARIYYLNYKASKDLRKVVESICPDIVHSNSSVIDIGLEICKKMSICHVWHIREYMDKGLGAFFLPNMKAFYKKLDSKYNYNVAITKEVFDYYNLRECDSIIYDGVCSIFEVPHDVTFVKEKYFLTVTRLQPGKAPLDVIKAFAILADKIPDYKLMVVGNTMNFETEYSRECLEFVKNHNLSDRIIFTGIRSDVYALMQHACANIVSSTFEGFGFITAESMLNGCVVIGRNTTGTKEQFDLGFDFVGTEIGLRFNEIEELVDQMKFVVNNDCREMIINAKKVAENYYSIQKCALNLDNFYKEILVKNEC